MQEIADHSPHGVVEVGAGLGYWARLLADRGVDVVAYDIAPPPSPDNRWFAGVHPWFPVAAADERVVAEHPDRTLVLIWPTPRQTWGADAALLHAASGGRRLVYVGEPPGGRTGDAGLHAVLGLVDRCLACAYGVLDVPCTCGVMAQWRLIEERPLPSWRGWDDRLYLFGPIAPPVPRRPVLRFSAVRRSRHGAAGRLAEPEEAASTGWAVAGAEDIHRHRVIDLGIPRRQWDDVSRRLFWQNSRPGIARYRAPPCPPAPVGAGALPSGSVRNGGVAPEVAGQVGPPADRE